MNEIPIFDSLTHPMPDGNWLHEKYAGQNTIEILIDQMRQENVKWALAVGMGESVGSYKESLYSSYIFEKSDSIFPIAYIDFPVLKDLDVSGIDSYMKSLVEMGYVGVKLHPRLGGFSYRDQAVSSLIKAAADHQLAVLLCTYCWSSCESVHENTPHSLMSLLSRVDSSPIILLHGGGVLLMQYIEIARAFNNVLLDLSLTLSKYRGSSIDLDIDFAFSQFDMRLCIGSDGPEFLPATLRERFNYFSKNISSEKSENIAYKNLFSFLPRVKV